MYRGMIKIDKLLLQGGENMNKIDWKRKLTSRKFWVTVATFVSMLIVAFGYAESVATQVASIIVAGGAVVAYILGEGYADAANVSASTQKTTTTK